jgi:hypothetical protein
MTVDILGFKTVFSVQKGNVGCWGPEYDFGNAVRATKPAEAHR